MKRAFKQTLRKALSLLTCLSLAASVLSSCNESDESNLTDTSSTTSSIDRPANVDDVESGKIDDIYSLVCSLVEQKLSEAGFESSAGVAYTTENDNYKAMGICYYNESSDLLKNDGLRTTGFVEITKDSSSEYKAENEDSLIVVDALNSSDSTEQICTFNYENIGSSHFVYQNKYITYTQESSMKVVYSELPNDESYYDLDLGSLYDYDNNRYIYDEEIFTGKYQNHYSTGFVTNEEYNKIAEQLKAIAEEQDKNGFSVEEYEVVYISPERIQAYLDSKEEDTFFGYKVNVLTETFGAGKTIEYKDGKLVEVSHWYDDLKDFAWKPFLLKLGGGIGIILIKTIGYAIKNHVPFGNVLICAVKNIGSKALGSVVNGLGTIAVETVSKIVNGTNPKEAILDSSTKGLDALANTFLISSIFTKLETSKQAKEVIPDEAESAGETIDVNNLRKQAVKDAWKKERQTVLDGKSKYNWTEEQRTELIENCKVSGYDGHHILTVKQLEGTENEWLIGSDKDIVFLSENDHLKVHGGNWNNETDFSVLIKILPWAKKTITSLAKLAA